MYKNTVFNDTIETDFLPAQPLSRPLYLLEMLEQRLLMSVVPIDATAGVPFHGLVAVELHLPSYATSPKLMNVLLNGQWDYTPTAVQNPDGTYDLYASMTPQKAGTSDMQIIFRNNDTGSWDTLETGLETVKDNHFSNVSPDRSIQEQIPGTQFKDPVAIFNTTALTQSLDHYVVSIDWYGKTKTGRLVQQGDGTVAAYVNDGYLPTDDSGSQITVTIHLASAPDGPPAGLATLSIDTGEVGIGGFSATMTSDTEVRVDLPTTPPTPGVMYGFFKPAAFQEGWPSTFTVQVIWQNRTGQDAATTVGSVVRQSNGNYAVVAPSPTDFQISFGMVKILETVHRPAIDGNPAQTYTISYVGSFGFTAPPVQTNPQNPTLPDPTQTDFYVPAMSSSENSAARRSPSPFASTPAIHDSLATDVFNKSDDPLLHRESDDLASLLD